MAAEEEDDPLPCIFDSDSDSDSEDGEFTGTPGFDNAQIIDKNEDDLPFVAVSDSEKSDSSGEVRGVNFPYNVQVVKMNSAKVNDFERGGRCRRRKSVFPPSGKQNDIAYLTATPLVIEKTQTRGQYHPMTQLDIRAEYDELTSVIQASKKRFRFIHAVANVGNLTNIMTNKFQVLHFSGHGFIAKDKKNLANFLAFEHEIHPGEAQRVTKKQLKDLIRSGRLRLVFVSACHSEGIGEYFATDEAGPKVHHVVCCQQEKELNDAAARKFTRHFYDELLSGSTVQEAFDVGKKAVNAMDGIEKRDAKKYILLPEGADHSQILFPNREEGEFQNETLVKMHNLLSFDVREFRGRALEQNQIINKLLKKRVVIVLGEKGIGKSQCVKATANYLSQREKVFPDGIFYFGIGDENTDLERFMKHTLIEGYSDQFDFNQASGVVKFLKQQAKSSGKSILIVLDQIEGALVSPECVTSHNMKQQINENWIFLKKLANLQGISILTASYERELYTEICKRCNLVAGKVELGPLSDNEARGMFLAMCPRFYHIETRDLNNILKILKGNPQHVRQVFFIIIAGSEDNSLQYLEQVVVEYAREKGILVVEDLSAFEDSLGKEFWRDHMDSCKEASFDEILDGFDNFVKQRTGMSRGIFWTRNDGHYKRDNIATRQELTNWVKGQPNMTMTIEEFANFWNERFHAIYYTIKHLEEIWETPGLIVFRSKKEVITIMQRLPQGSFCIRFSETYPHRLSPCLCFGNRECRNILFGILPNQSVFNYSNGKVVTRTIGNCIHKGSPFTTLYNFFNHTLERKGNQFKMKKINKNAAPLYCCKGRNCTKI